MNPSFLQQINNVATLERNWKAMKETHRNSLKNNYPSPLVVKTQPQSIKENEFSLGLLKKMIPKSKIDLFCNENLIKSLNESDYLQNSSYRSEKSNEISNKLTGRLKTSLSRDEKHKNYMQNIFYKYSNIHQKEHNDSLLGILFLYAKFA